MTFILVNRNTCMRDIIINIHTQIFKINTPSTLFTVLHLEYNEHYKITPNCIIIHTALIHNCMISCCKTVFCFVKKVLVKVPLTPRI